MAGGRVYPESACTQPQHGRTKHGNVWSSNRRRAIRSISVIRSTYEHGSRTLQKSCQPFTRTCGYALTSWSLPRMDEWPAAPLAAPLPRPPLPPLPQPLHGQPRRCSWFDAFCQPLLLQRSRDRRSEVYLRAYRRLYRLLYCRCSPPCRLSRFPPETSA